ncbi:MAG: transcription elongation factor subunit Spt4 [Halobacteriales archaeon]
MATNRLVCRDCHRVQDDPDSETCDVCGSNSLTEDWSGYVIILHPATSEIAQEMEVEEPGKYALKVR